MRRRLALLEDAHPGRPAFDTALSRALLLRTGRGERGETLRLHCTGPVMAFSVLDRTRPGFARAVAAARGRGFAPVLRLAGGRAAVFHEQTLALAWSMPADLPRAGIRARFEEVADVVSSALRRLGVDARIGEVAGEYCPGEFSVNARGRTKLAGLGQRVVRGAAHVGGVLVAGGSERIRRVLVPVYEALGFPFDPATVGSVEDEIGAPALAAVRDALLGELRARYAVHAEVPDAQSLALAGTMEAQHEAHPRAALPALEQAAPGAKCGIERPAGALARLAHAPERR